MATATVAPLPPRSGGEGSGVGGASANSQPEEQADRPPTPDPSPPRARRVEGGEMTEHGFAISGRRRAARSRDDALIAWASAEPVFARHFPLFRFLLAADASESASGRKISRRVVRVGVSIGLSGNYFWHFGHQKVERPFWVKRLTMPPQPAVWHFSPSRS
jgi:hypothetical protein